MNGDRWSSHVKKGVIMGLVVPVIGAGDNVAEAKVFYSMFGNVKFQVLDLEVGLDKGLGDTGEGGEE